MSAPAVLLCLAGLVSAAAPAAAPAPRSCGGERSELARPASLTREAPAEFEVAEALNGSFRAIGIDSIPSPREDYSQRLSRSIKEKAAALEETITAYEEVASSREDYWRGAARFRMGEAYVHYAESVEGASFPKKFSRAQRAQFCTSLRRRASSYRNKAIEHFKVCAATAGSDPAAEWTRLCAGALSLQQRLLSTSATTQPAKENAL